MDYASILASTFSLIGVIITVIVGNKSTRNLVEYRLTSLEDSVKKHNNLIERTYRLEDDSETLKDDVSTLKKDVSHLKDDVNKLKTDIAVLKAYDDGK